MRHLRTVVPDYQQKQVILKSRYELKTINEPSKKCIGQKNFSWISRFSTTLHLILKSVYWNASQSFNEFAVISLSTRKKKKRLRRTWQRLEVIWNLTDTDLCIAYIRNQILIRYSWNLFSFSLYCFQHRTKKKAETLRKSLLNILVSSKTCLTSLRSDHNLFCHLNLSACQNKDQVVSSGGLISLLRIM